MLHRWGGALVAVGLAAVLAVAILVRQVGSDVPFIDVPFFGGGGSPSDDALRQDAPPPFSGPAVSDVRGAVSVVGDEPASEPVLPVAIEPPEGAAEMQLADNPSFNGASWLPVASEARVPVSGNGYQMVFVRFRLADGSISRSSIAGGEVNPTLAAAVASETGDHEASWIGPLSSTELVVRIEAGRIEPGSLEAYDLDNPAPGDDIDEKDGMKIVRRDGEAYGLQVSARTDVIRRPDRLRGRPLDVGAVLGDGWTVSSADDPAYAGEVAPVSIRHLARPTDGGLDGDGERLWAVVHDLVITLPTPLQPGATYRIVPPTVAPAELSYDPATNRSPAVRVNQVGFAPDDEDKVAQVAGWFDGIGATAVAQTAPGFRVVDAESGDEVFSGTGRPRGVTDELGRGDLTGSPVIDLDFSPLDRPGRYRVCVDGIGCSYDFEIDDHVWEDLTTTVARALYHQRSGVELGPPYTSFVRPRPYHPEDGVVVRASTYTLLEAQTETENTNFARLAELGTSEVVAEAWGGHFDAGDWDRRVNHLAMVRNAAELVLLYPERFAGLELDIPESGDGVPDLLDEALWSLDLYRRMQTEDGGIRGGIEATEHPPRNATSWTDDLAVFAYAPDTFSSYLYAGVAAEFSVALRPYDPARADELLDSALRAMGWAEAQAVPPGDQAERVDPRRSQAAAALLLATGDRRWHDRFVETADFLGTGDTNLSCHSHTRCDAAWIYLQVDESLTDAAIRDDLRARFLASADAIIATAEATAFGWSLENPEVSLIWGLGVGGAPNASGLLRAYLLSGDERYRAAAVRSSSVSLGSNPLNRALLTGVGDEPVRYPQINDVKNGGIPTWPGTPVYGNHQLNAVADEQWVVDDLLGPAGASPDPNDLPYLWQWYDVDSIAMFNEFTVHQSHGEAMLVFGLLAATTP